MFFHSNSPTFCFKQKYIFNYKYRTLRSIWSTHAFSNVTCLK